MDGADFFRSLLSTLAGAIIGALSAIATFRAKFIVIDLRFQQEAERYATQRAHDKEMLDATLGAMRRDIQRARRASTRMERRQSVSLELIADIARKLEISHRAIGTDAAARTISDAEHDQ